jgi:PAS domain S-box-containing protein
MAIWSHRPPPATTQGQAISPHVLQDDTFQPSGPPAGSGAQPLALFDGGDMGAAMRRFDWSRSPLGPPERWPQSLRTAANMMLNTQQPMFIAWGPELAFIYNDAYAPILGIRHPAALAQPFKEVWSEIWPDLLPLIESALAGTPVWQEDLPLLMHRYGHPEQTYFTFTYSPLHDESGAVTGMFCTCIETTARVKAERDLRSAADALRMSEERYRRQGERLFSLFEEAPGFVAALDGAEHVFTLTNAAYRQLIGHRDVIGLPARQGLPEAAPSGLFEVLDRVFSSGEPFVGSGVRVPLQRTAGGTAEERIVDFVYQPIRNEAGTITGIFVQGSDVTDRELFLERQQMLLNELNHRVKNNLATVQSMAAQTARRAPDLPQFLDDFEGRLIALARTHDVLTATAWSGAEIIDVLRSELHLFNDRVQMSGPTVRLDATQALALGLICHELVTNAVKYGALSTAGGRITVNWRIAADGAAFVLDWSERGGPPVATPTRTGFGSRLIQKLSTGDLRGELLPDYAPDGLRVRLTAPLETAG